MYERTLRTLKNEDIEISEYLSLEKMNSMRIKSVARVAVFPRSVDSLIGCIRILLEDKVKFRVVGGMTNTLVKNVFFDGALVFTAKLRGKSRAENGFLLECGVRTGEFVEYGLSLGFGGAEGLRSIPGMVGGAVFGNAGAFGSSVSDSFLRGDFFDLESGFVLSLTKEEMNFSYRHSVMQDRALLLLRAEFSLNECNVKSARDKIAEFSKIRKERQPVASFSLGSVFKRVGEVGAGYYIEGAGLKGRSLGGAEVSEKHAGFIINRGGATAAEVLKLIEIIKDAVLKKYGVELETEIQII